MAEQVTDFTKKAPAALRTGLPIPIGQPVNIKKLSDLERKTLRELGLQDATMLPSNLHEIMAQAKREAADVNSIPDPASEFNLPADFKLTVPPEQDVEDLPPALRKQYEKTIAEMHAAASRLSPPETGPSLQQQIVQKAVEKSRLTANENARFARLDPSVAQAIMHGQQEEPEVVDDLASAPAEEAKAESEAPAKECKCERCGWQVGVAVEDKITSQDMFLYLQTLLSGNFVKTYQLFDGRLTLTVRTLTPVEQDAIQAQIFRDQTDGRVVTQFDYLEHMMRYRTALQLVSLIDNGPSGKVFNMPTSLDGWKVSQALAESPDLETQPVAAVWKLVVSAVLSNESAYRMVNETVLRFNQLVANIEKASLSPNFLQATGK